MGYVIFRRVEKTKIFHREKMKILYFEYSGKDSLISPLLQKKKKTRAHVPLQFFVICNIGGEIYNYYSDPSQMFF